MGRRLEKFRVRLRPSELDSPCWEWLHARNKDGYGYLKRGDRGQNVYAHRMAYQLAYGDLRDYLVVDHLCSNPPCVNPAHLEQVTLSENARRGQLRRWARTRANPTVD